MRHIKMISAIVAAALLTGCANDTAVSSTAAETTAQTTTTAETTVQTTTTNSTTASTILGPTAWESSSADLNLVDDSKPITSEDVSNSQNQLEDDQTNADQNHPGMIEGEKYPDKPIEETRPNINEAKPPQESEKTPDGKYDLADTDLVNTDGTYTVDTDKLTEATKEDTLPSTLDWSKEYYDWFVEGVDPNPSKIPYSEITLENAAEAFPFLGYTGKYPNYIEILPTDNAETIARKVRENIMGESSTSYMGGSDLWQYHNFKSQAEYDAYLVEQERLAAESEAKGQQAEDHAQAVVNGEASIGGNASEDVVMGLW